MNSGPLTMRFSVRFLGFKARLARILFTLIGFNSVLLMFLVVVRRSRTIPFCLSICRRLIPFFSNLEDNFFVNMSYNVRKKNLVNKTFATRLSNR